MRWLWLVAATATAQDIIEATAQEGSVEAPEDTIATFEATAQEGSVVLFESPEDTIAAFETWFKLVGGQAQGLEIFHTEKKGYGVRTTNEIQEGDEIIVVPKEMVFSRTAALDPKTLTERGITPPIRDALARTTYDEDLIALLLMRERAKGEDSFFAPWMKMLQKKAVLTPSLLHQDRMREVLDASAYHRAKPAGKRRSDRYHRIKEQIRAVVEDFQTYGGEDIHSLEAFIWADSIVSSRAITTTKEGKILAPFFDMLNYAPHPQARKRNHLRIFDQNHRILGSLFMITADRHTRSGQEVSEDYGKHDSEHYFHTAGFVPDVNPFDCVTVRLPPPAVRSKARPLVRMLGVPQDPEGCLRPGRPIPEQMLYHLHMLSLTEDDAIACVKRLGEDPDAGALPCFDESYTVDTAWKKLQEIIAEQLATPKKTWPPHPEDEEKDWGPFIPKPSEMQPSIDMFEASRKKLMQVLLESPAPPALEDFEEDLLPDEPEEEEEKEELRDPTKDGRGLGGYVGGYHGPYIEALHYAQADLGQQAKNALDDEEMKNNGVGVRQKAEKELRWGPKEASKTPLSGPAKEAKEKEAMRAADWPKSVRATLRELRGEVGKVLEDPAGFCSASE